MSDATELRKLLEELEGRIAGYAARMKGATGTDWAYHKCLLYKSEEIAYIIRARLAALEGGE